MDELTEYSELFLILIPVFILFIYLAISEIRDILTELRYGLFSIQNILNSIYLEEEDMVETYSTLIIMGKKTFAQVPVRIKEQVRQCLIDLGVEFLIEEQE